MLIRKPKPLGIKKYKNKPAQRVVDGKIKEFDSILEAKRYDHLFLFQRAKLIKDLELQVSFTVFDGFTHKGKKKQAITYAPDFVYEKKVGQEWIKVVDDAKGMLTEPTRMRQKMFLMRYGTEYLAINTKLERTNWIEKEF